LSVVHLDYSWFHAINGLAGKWPAADLMMKFLADNAVYVICFGMVIYWFTQKRMNRPMVVQAVVSAFTAFGIGSIISHMFSRDRPFVTHSVTQLIYHTADASFPSDHAIGAFAIAATIVMFHKRTGLIWLLLASGIAFSRVWAGIHYPLDVAAGAVIGGISATAIHKLFTLPAMGRMVQSSIRFYEAAESRLWSTQHRNGG